VAVQRREPRYEGQVESILERHLIALPVRVERIGTSDRQTRAVRMRYRRWTMLREADGNLLDAPVDAIVNTVNSLLGQPRVIINFPTKKHWRSQSVLADIKSGLDDLRRVIGERQIESIAVPALGCGNGGLNWRDVRALIVSALGDLPGVDVVVYPPKGAPRSSVA
jgi:hypothetical protein